MKFWSSGTEDRSSVKTLAEDPTETIGLADAVEALRAEIAVAQKKAAGAGVQFPVQSLTVELKVAVTKSADGKAGFKVPLLGAELGGGAGYKNEEIQTVTLVLGAPVDSDGRPHPIAKVSDSKYE